MSYSFATRALNKHDLRHNVAQELQTVVENQPSHSVDKTQALHAADAFIGLMTEPTEGKQLYANVNGSIWTNEQGLQSASFGVSVGYQDLPKPVSVEDAAAAVAAVAQG